MSAHLIPLGLNPVDAVGGAIGAVGGAVGGVVGDVAGGAVEKTLGGIASMMSDAVGEVIADLSTFWVHVPSPNVESGATQLLTSSLSYITLSIAACAVMFGAAKMALEMRAEPGKAVARSVVTLMLATAVGATLTQTLLSIGDAYAPWVLSQATDQPFGKAMMKFLAATNISSPILVMVLSLVALVLGLMQVVMMAFRSAALVMVVAFLPLSASFTNTAKGKQMFDTITGWILAFTLYKPAAASIYAASFIMFGHGEGMTGYLQGLAAMTLAVVAIGPMVKLFVPAASGMAGGMGLGGLIAAGAGGAGMMRGLAGGAGKAGEAATGAVPTPPMPSTAGQGAPPTGSSTSAGTAGAGAGAAAKAGAASTAGTSAGAAATGAATAAAGPVGVGVAAAMSAVGAVTSTIESSVSPEARNAGGPSGSN